MSLLPVEAVRRRKQARLLGGVALLLAASIAASCQTEAAFRLSPQSRLPAWFGVDNGRLPDDAIVELVEYSDGTARMTLYRPARMGVFGVSGSKQLEVRGEFEVDPFAADVKNGLGGVDPDAYPRYAVMRVGSISEVLEFRKMEPVFYVSDDPNLRDAVERNSKFK